jgi:putative FmdB family regulatory protein
LPIYEYTCNECSIRFEKMRKLAEHDDPANCPECGTVVNKVPSATNFAFAGAIVGGPRPQNTGVHSIDYNADRVIGRDAESRWKTITERQDYKRKVLRDNPGATGFDLSRTRDGDYKVMKPEERQASERGRALHTQALSAIASDTKKTGTG